MRSKDDPKKMYQITDFIREYMRIRLSEMGFATRSGRLKVKDVAEYFTNHGVKFSRPEVSQWFGKKPRQRHSEKVQDMLLALNIPMFELFELTEDEKTLLRCYHDAESIDKTVSQALVAIVVRYVRLALETHDQQNPQEKLSDKKYTKN